MQKKRFIIIQEKKYSLRQVTSHAPFVLSSRSVFTGWTGCTIMLIDVNLFLSVLLPVPCQCTTNSVVSGQRLMQITTLPVWMACLNCFWQEKQKKQMKKKIVHRNINRDLIFSLKTVNVMLYRCPLNWGSAFDASEPVCWENAVQKQNIQRWNCKANSLVKEPYFCRHSFQICG